MTPEREKEIRAMNLRDVALELLNEIDRLRKEKIEIREATYSILDETCSKSIDITLYLTGKMTKKLQRITNAANRVIEIGTNLKPSGFTTALRDLRDALNSSAWDDETHQPGS